TIVAEIRILHRGLELGIVDAVKLEREKEKMQRCRRNPLLDVAIELGADRIGRIAGIDKRRVRDQAPESVVDCFKALNGGSKGAPGTLAFCQFRQAPLEVLLEGRAVGVRSIQVALELRAIEARIKVAQVPLRQRAELACFDWRLTG